MTWKTVSRYCMASGEYRISKANSMQGTQYVAWHDIELIGVFDSAESAKKAVKLHAQQAESGDK